MAALLASGPSLGTILLTAFVLGDAVALYALSRKSESPMTWAESAAKAKIIRAIRMEVSAFAAKKSAAEVGTTPPDVVPPDKTAFQASVEYGLADKLHLLYEAIEMAKKSPSLLTEEYDGKPFLPWFIKKAIVAVKADKIDRGFSATAAASEVFAPSKLTMKARSERAEALYNPPPTGGARASELSTLTRMALNQLVVDGKTPKAAPDAFWELVHTHGKSNQKVYDAMIGVMVEFMNFKDSPDRWVGKKSNAQGLADILFMTADKELKDLLTVEGEAVNELFFRNRTGVQNSWGKFFSTHEYADKERERAALAETTGQPQGNRTNGTSGSPTNGHGHQPSGPEAPVQDQLLQVAPPAPWRPRL